MASDKNPVFRKAIIPWYHSKKTYVAVIVLIFLVFLFGIGGISIARENEEYQSFIWIPILLIVMSGTLIVTITIRLIRRSLSRSQK
jgi:hypothetical protein